MDKQERMRQFIALLDIAIEMGKEINRLLDDRELYLVAYSAQNAKNTGLISD